MDSKFLDFSPSLLKAVNSALDPTCAPSEVLAHAHSLSITREDMLRLRDLDVKDAPTNNTWLNCNLMSFYCGSINTLYKPAMSASASAAAKTPNVHVCSTTFFNKVTENTLSPLIKSEFIHLDVEPAVCGGETDTTPRVVLERGYNYDNVRNWISKLGYDVSLMECVLFPLHLHTTHWACAVLWPRRRKYAYIDSWPGVATSDQADVYMTILKRWYLDEYNDKHPEAAAALTAADMAAWKRVTPSIMPLQTNCDDCGIFTLMAIEWVAAGLEHHLTYTQADMPTLRRYIAACILQDEII